MIGESRGDSKKGGDLLPNLLQKILIRWALNTSEKRMEAQQPPWRRSAMTMGMKMILGLVALVVALATTRDSSSLHWMPITIDKRTIAGTNGLSRDGLTYKCALPNGTTTKMSAAAFPQFIIAGTQKGGTTSMGVILSSHLNLTQSKEFEAHFFDKYPRFLESGLDFSDEAAWCQYRKAYHDCFPPLSESQLAGHWTFEKTPIYMLLMTEVPRLIAKLMEPFPNKPKIIMVLRDPVERAFSKYKMDNDRGRNYGKKTFEEKVSIGIHKLRKHGISHAPVFNESMSASEWRMLPHSDFAEPDDSLVKTNILQNFKVWKSADTFELTRGLYAYQISSWDKLFPLGEKLLVINYETYQKHKQQVLDQIMNFTNLPQHIFSESLLNSDHSPEQQLNYTKKATILMKDATKAYLQRFFAPHNALLEQLLGSEWKGVWQYNSSQIIET